MKLIPRTTNRGSTGLPANCRTWSTSTVVEHRCHQFVVDDDVEQFADEGLYRHRPACRGWTQTNNDLVLNLHEIEGPAFGNFRWHEAAAWHLGVDSDPAAATKGQVGSDRPGARPQRNTAQRPPGRPRIAAGRSPGQPAVPLENGSRPPSRPTGSPCRPPVSPNPPPSTGLEQGKIPAGNCLLAALADQHSLAIFAAQ